jgi:hypothetical protein
MNRPVATIALLILYATANPAQNVVWNWVPNPYAGNDIFPNLIGNLLFINPGGGFNSMPIDINGDGSVDFEFRVYNSSYSSVDVLQHGSNEVLAVLAPPGEIGETAVALYRSNVVTSLPPVGAEWLPEIIVDPYEIGAMLGGEFSAENQYTDKRAFFGVRFYAADGVHYGALQVIAAGGNPVIGIIFGYGYNPTPDAPRHSDSRRRRASKSPGRTVQFASGKDVASAVDGDGHLRTISDTIFYND